MPKSKRNRVVHMTNVTKKTREHKERLFENVRDSLSTYQYCFVFSVDNMRNTHLKEVRQDLSDSRFVSPSLPPSLTHTHTHTHSIPKGKENRNRKLT